MARRKSRAYRPPEVPYEKLRRLPAAHPGTNNAVLSIVEGAKKGYAKLDNKPLWVYDQSADFGISGTTAQSAGKRDFYAHNFNQPTYTFLAQTHNEREYGEISEFIRAGQLGAVFNDRLFEIFMPEKGFKAGRSMRGRRSAVHLRGYVQNAQRHHERFVQAPEFTLTFVILQTLAGPVRDDAVTPRILPTDWTSFINRDGTTFVTKPTSGDPGDEQKPKPKKKTPKRQDLRNPDQRRNTPRQDLRNK